MPSIFTKIVQGEVPCYKVAENERFLAFLDIYPVAKGHTLVIPKQEIDYYFDLEDDLIAEMNIFAKKVAIALKKYTNCKRICTAVIGYEVPHAHLHLIPTNSMADVQFSKKLKFSPEEFKEIAQDIQKFL
ncbi:MAG: HIT family protein [Microscillaceae bacterium]|nr:HIT family protein [Microscillaceae bacterium]MDW8459629.1 HIT family protein [Cytophagales bacterium]